MSEWFGHFILQINLWQRQLNAQVATSFRELDETGLAGIAVILGIAFLYGLIHAAGPGHGKALVGTYFIAHGKRISAAFKIGYLVAIIHTLSALTLTFGIYYLIEGVFSRTFNQALEMMYTVSGSIILLLGVYLIYELYQEWDLFEERTAAVDAKKAFTLAFAVGIVPCPGVMTVLLFSLMLGKLFVGVLAAVMMSLGMGLTISLAGAAAVTASKAGGRNRNVIRTLRIFSPILVIGLGIFLIV